MANIKLNNNLYPIPDAVLAAHTADFVAHLGTIAGSGMKVVIGGVEYGVDASKVAGAVSGLDIFFNSLQSSLAPGLYQTGAIDLYKNGDIEGASAMIVTPWEELEANNAIMVSKGEDIELPEMNEYGFYFGVPYSDIERTTSYTFYEDGSARLDKYGDVIEAPAGSVVYTDHSIDLSVAMDAENYVFIVQDNGKTIGYFDIELYLGAGVPPKGMVYSPYYEDGAVVFNGDLILPNDGSVTDIASYSFAYQEGLTGIIIPNGVTHIRLGVCSGCQNITNIIIPNSVTKISMYAFSFCGNLINIEIPIGVTSIGDSAFAWCDSLTSITIPSSMTFIGEEALANCKNLEKIIFKGTVAQWNAITKGDNWNGNVFASQVQCTDGYVSIKEK